MKKYIAIFFTITVPFLLSAQNNLKSKIPELQSFIKEKMAAGKVPGFSVAVSQNDKILWEEGFGLADKEKQIAATAHTSYPVGSVSKTMTMTAIMQLVNEKKINLDAPVSKYLKKAHITAGNFNADRVTVRRVASHTAGLARHTTMYYLDEDVTPHSLPQLINDYAFIMRPPGESYEYSDMGYGILSQVVEDVSGEPFSAYMQKNIFGKIHMDDSFFDTGFHRERTIAASYTRGEKMRDYYSPVYGAASANSSVHDIALLGMFLLNKKYAANLMEIQKPLAQRSASYAYGMALHIYDNYGGPKVLIHHGHNGYATTTFFLLPSLNLCITAAANSSTSLPEEVGEKIMSLLVPGFDMNLLNTQRRTWNPPSSPFQTTEPYIGNWKGFIQFDTMKIPLQLWFQPDGDIHVQLRNQYRTLLNGVRQQEGYLRGSFNSDLDIPGAKNYPSNLHLKIKLRSDSLINGSITQSSNGGTDRISVLSYPVEFIKSKQ